MAFAGGVFAFLVSVLLCIPLGFGEGYTVCNMASVLVAMGSDTGR